MTILFPFHVGDQQQAERWMRWQVEQGGCRGHSVVLMPAKQIRDFAAVEELARQAFGSVRILPDSEGIEGHPAGPNCMMRQAVWDLELMKIPWTFMEPDCIPLVPEWLDQWEREYRAFGKPFMGELRPGNGTTPEYLTGNMVLPANALSQAPLLSRRGLSRDGVELAFDIVAASQTLPRAHLTKLLQQVPKNSDGSSATFPDQASLSIIRPGAVLFHPCKDGTLIDRLREQKTGVCVSGLNVSASRDAQERSAAHVTVAALPPEGSTPSTPTAAPATIDDSGVDHHGLLIVEGCDGDPVKLTARIYDLERLKWKLYERIKTLELALNKARTAGKSPRKPKRKRKSKGASQRLLAALAKAREIKAEKLAAKA